MAKTYKYFAIALDKLPEPAPYEAVWYASWSSVRPALGPQTHVTGASASPLPFVIGATTGALPAQATLIGKGARSGCPAPPPLPCPETTCADYFASIQRWLSSGTGTQPCSYFSIPFAAVPSQPPYVTWYAAWSPLRPAVEPGWLPPLVICATAGEVPATGQFIMPLAKDPPPPPPVLASPDMTLASFVTPLGDRGA